jgi:hypothetical protein
LPSVVSRRHVPVFCAALVACAATSAPAWANAPVGSLTAAPARSVAANPPTLTTPARPHSAAINRPTVSMSAYKAAKANAAAARGLAKPAAPGLNNPRGPSAPSAVGFQGINKAQSDGWFPSDVNGAMGASFNALTTNDRYVVYKKATTATILKNVSLNTFFGYANQSMFDPRVVYDTVWKRFVVSADAFEESASSQIFGLAITKSSNAAGPIWDYLLNAKAVCGNDVFVDYPQISTSQDAVLVTVNCFRNSDGAYLGARSFAVAKAILYNGLGFSVPVFAPSTNATATPPNVLDGNPQTHLLLSGEATPVRDVTWQDPQGGFYASMAAPVNITGFHAPSVPPSARQSGCSTTSCRIDTSDGRFVSPSTQVGTSIWNVATFSNAGFAEPYWGEFDTNAHTTKQTGTRFLSATSDDYNASLVSGADGRMFMNWSSSSPTTFISNALAARKAADAAGTLPTLLVPFTSSSTLTGDFDANFGVQRWGDTSQITRDPTASTAWSWNGDVSGSSWGTFTAKFINP